MNLNIDEKCEGARYSDVLNELITELNGKEILRLKYNADYQGYVDIDVLLEDGRVLSYEYFYGSCMGCDDWEARELTEEEIKHEMKDQATIFDNRESYNNWRAMVIKRNIE